LSANGGGAQHPVLRQELNTARLAAAAL